MRPRRTLVAGMLGIVATIAIGTAALRYASPAWLMLTALSTLALLFTSLHFAIRGSNRAFWRGVALFGWGYLLLDCLPALQIDAPIRTFLIRFYPVLHHDPPRQEPGATGPGIGVAPGTAPPIKRLDTESHWFLGVGIWLSILLFALVGGIVGGVVAGKRTREAGS